MGLKTMDDLKDYSKAEIITAFEEYMKEVLFHEGVTFVGAMDEGQARDIAYRIEAVAQKAYE
jgi:hypothetical protein